MAIDYGGLYSQQSVAQRMQAAYCSGKTYVVTQGNNDIANVCVGKEENKSTKQQKLLLLEDV